MNKLWFCIIGLAMILSVNSAYPQAIERRALSLEEMFLLADKNNRSIAAFSTAVEAAEEEVKAAKSAYLPSLDIALSASYNGDGTIMDRNFSNSFAAPIAHFGNNFSVEASQVIFAGGAIRSGVKIAKLKSQIAAFNAESNRQKTRFLLVGDYLQLCKLSNQLQVFESNILQTQKVLENMRLRRSEGTVLQNNITRYELQLQDLNYRKIEIQNEIKLLNNKITESIGLPQSVVIAADISVADNNYPPLKKVNIKQSLAVKTAQTAQEISIQAEKIARAQLLPQVAIFAGDYLNGPITTEIPSIDKNFNYWAAGVGIKYSLGAFYKSAAKIQASRLYARQAQEETAVAQEQVKLALDAAIVHYKEAFDLLKAKEKSVELAVQNYEVISYRYQNNLSLITELLDASTQKLDAQLQAINAQINIVFNYYKIKYIAGDL